MEAPRTVVRNYIREKLLGNEEAEELTDDSNLLMAGLVNSLGMMRLIAFVERKLKVRIPPEDVTIENFVSINAMAEYLERLGER